MGPALTRGIQKRGTFADGEAWEKEPAALSQGAGGRAESKGRAVLRRHSGEGSRSRQRRSPGTNSRPLAAAGRRSCPEDALSPCCWIAAAAFDPARGKPVPPPVPWGFGPRRTGQPGRGWTPVLACAGLCRDQVSEVPALALPRGPSLVPLSLPGPWDGYRRSVTLTVGSGGVCCGEIPLPWSSEIARVRARAGGRGSV